GGRHERGTSDAAGTGRAYRRRDGRRLPHGQHRALRDRHASPLAGAVAHDLADQGNPRADPHRSPVRTPARPWPRQITRSQSWLVHKKPAIAFGVTRLLGFDLLPRIKQINKTRLYRPVAGEPGAWPRLEPALTRPIRWDLVASQYDQMIKYAAAIRAGTAST